MTGQLHDLDLDATAQRWRDDPQREFARTYPAGIHLVPIEHVQAIRDPENPGVDGNVDISGGIREPLDVGVLGGYANLEDGHHRLNRAELAELTHLPVNVIAYG